MLSIIWKVIKISFIKDHYFPFNETNIVLLLSDVMMFCRASRYLICIADLEFKIYDVYFNNFAASTSALAEMILASETLFWIAADCIFFLTYSDRIKSLIKIFSM